MLNILISTDECHKIEIINWKTKIKLSRLYYYKKTSEILDIISTDYYGTTVVLYFYSLLIFW